MTGGTYALIFAGLAAALLIAVLAPPPARASDTDPGIPTGLLVAACAATLLMGAFALSAHHLEAVICGAAAWLIVVPCLWLARAGDGWEDEDEDEDGGSPRPAAPFTPPAPDDRLPGLDPSGRAGAPGAWVTAPAIALTPATATAEAPLPAWAMRQGSPAWAIAQRAAEPRFAVPAEDRDEAPPPAGEPVWEPVARTAPAGEETDPPAQRRAGRSAPRVRGEHRSVEHVHVRVRTHPHRRPQRAGLPRRVLRTCRRWLGIGSPDCRLDYAPRDALEHGARRHAVGSGSRERARRDAISR